MSEAERTPRITWRTFITGRGVRELSAGQRLVVDLVSLCAALGLALLLLLVSHNNRGVWTFVVGFGGASLVVALGRYWLRR